MINLKSIFSVIIINLACCCYYEITYANMEFLIPENPYPSNILVNQLKEFIRNIINNKNISYYKERIKKIVKEDIEFCNQHKNQEVNYNNNDHLHWILLYCTELADNPKTKDFYNEIEYAVINMVEMK